MRKLYKITIILSVIALILSLGIELFIEYICSNRNINEESLLNYDKCKRLYHNIFNGGLFELFMLFNGILVIFSISGLILDGFHYIIEKLKKN